MKKIALYVLTFALVITMGVVAVCADEFVPSIEVKEAPDVVASEGVAAVISGSGADINVTESELTITSLSTAKDGTDEISKTLVDAYNDIKSVERVEDKVNGLEKVAEELGIENATFSVANIFDVSVTAEQKASLGAKDTFITVVFTNEIKATQDNLIVAHMVNDKWVTVDAEKVKVTADTITVDFDDLCPVMFITAAEGEPVVTPDAGNGWVVWVIIAVVVVAAAAVAFVFLKKKKA